MKARTWRERLLLQEDLNFLLTNRLPRRWATLCMGRLSRIRSPWLTRLFIGIWRLFTDLDFSDARQQRFSSLQECFTRELRPGSRPVDPDPTVMVSPCDAIVGACGPVEGTQVFQAKGFPYTLEDLFGRYGLCRAYRNGCFVTLRLTSSMYHRFHAPDDCIVEHVSYLSGDTWNVNPIALQRIERLFCRNERALVHCRHERTGALFTLVPVAAILVASIRLHFLDVLLHLRHRGPNEFPCRARFARGQEMGWFEHGSTILMFAPEGARLCDGIMAGARIRVGQRLMTMP